MYYRTWKCVHMIMEQWGEFAVSLVVNTCKILHNSIHWNIINWYKGTSFKPMKMPQWHKAEYM